LDFSGRYCPLPSLNGYQQLGSGAGHRKNGSPDLNPIENLWMRLKKILSKGGRASSKRIVKAWHRLITREELLKLVESMPRCCQLVIFSKSVPKLKGPFQGHRIAQRVVQKYYFK